MYKTILVVMFVLLSTLFLSQVNSKIKYNDHYILSIDDYQYMKLLNITQSDESKDYIVNKTQYQLNNLTTEQIHYKTQNLSLINNITEALLELLSVDQDITDRIKSLNNYEIEKLENLIIKK